MQINQLRKKIINDLSNAEIKSAEIDAEILLEFISKKSREFLLANPDFELSISEIEKLNNLVKRRKKHEPIAYITGQKEFFGLDFNVTPDVLIPRPETEILVEEALKFIEKVQMNILDVGTGSGNIIISIAKNTQGVFTASDISEKSLAVAKQNAKNHDADIKFIQSDLLEKIDGKFDLIVANLPYVPIDGSKDREIKYEPRDAIFAEDNGSAIIKKFIKDVKNHLNQNSKILLEVDPRNANDLVQLASRSFENVELMEDYSGEDRFLKITN